MKVLEATLGSEKAKLEKRIAETGVDEAAGRGRGGRRRSDRHQIRSPLNGMIVKVHRHAGEWVQPGDPVLHVIRIDHLWVEGFAKAAKHSPNALRRTARVEVLVTPGRRPAAMTVPGKVIFVDPDHPGGRPVPGPRRSAKHRRRRRLGPLPGARREDDRLAEVNGNPARQPALQFRAEAADPQAARPLGTPTAVPRPQLLGRQGARSACTTSASRRRSTPSCKCWTATSAWTRSRSASRPNSPAKDHPGRVAAISGHVAPQRAGHGRRAGTGPRTPQAPQRAPPQGIDQALSNVLCIRFKGIDPERLLERLYPYVRWFFSPPAVRLLPVLAFRR